MLVRDIMNTNLKTISVDQTIQRAADIFLEANIEGLPVINRENRLVGLITKSHIFKAFIKGVSRQTLIKDVMTKEVTTILDDAEAEGALGMPVGRLPVINRKDQLVGIITRTDLLRAFYDYSQKILGELNTILESARNAIVAINNAGEISIFNKAASRVVGINVENAIGRPVDKILPRTGLLDVIKTGESQIATKLKIGETLVISNRTPLIKDNEIIGAIGIFQDISDLESISNELKYTRNLNRELDAIIENVSDGLYITDGEGYTTRVNSTYEKISGIKAEEVIGRHMQELVEEGYYSESVTLHVLEERKPVTITHEIRTGVEVMVTGIPVFDEKDNIVSVVTTVRDMKALSRMKQELQESKKLTTRYYNELEQLRLQQLELEDVIVESPTMREILDLAIHLGQFNSTILITGESGVGKEIIARVIHKAGHSKRQGSLIKVNCGAIPDNLIESELFGYEKGAFTGAKKDGKPGLFELAENGTLFLDEIAELPLNLQAKLLRILQEREFLRVGGTRPIKINTRIIAATNKDLEKLVETGDFREDLYYRLNVVPIVVPSLRERKEDICPLVLHFLRKFNERFKTNKKISLDLIDYLENYNWPGNVRQLENTIERLVVMVPDNIITIEHLSTELKEKIDKIGQEDKRFYSKRTLNIRKAVEQVEKEVIIRAMEKVETTREIAALVGVSQPTVVRKLKKYDLKV